MLQLSELGIYIYCTFESNIGQKLNLAQCAASVGVESLVPSRTTSISSSSTATSTTTKPVSSMLVIVSSPTPTTPMNTSNMTYIQVSFAPAMLAGWRELVTSLFVALVTTSAVIFG